jgi:hypothetical protein
LLAPTPVTDVIVGGGVVSVMSGLIGVTEPSAENPLKSVAVSPKKD